MRRLSVVAAILLAACGSATTATSPLPGPGDAELIGQGSELYQANCAQCHGADLRGTDRGPSFLSEVYVPTHHADAAFLLAVQRGVPSHHWGFGDMPAVPGLSPEQVAAIVAYVRSEQQNQGFEPYPP